MDEKTVELKEVEVNFGTKESLKIETLSAYMNERIAIIGANGSGKSTLLKMIAGEFEGYTGEVETAAEFNYFAQIGEAGGVDEGFDFELLSRLDVPDNEGLSGGEATKLRLAHILSGYRPGLLLDEPTTHLDEAGVSLLIDELEYYYGTLIFVSHDRHFINSLAETIWEVSDGTVREYTGNYDDYEAQKEQERLAREREYDNFISEKKRLENAVQKQIEKAEKMKAVKKNKQDIKPDRLSSSKQKDTVQKQAFKAAKSIESRLGQLEEAAPPRAETHLKFPMPESLEIHNKFPIMAQDLTVVRGGRMLLDRVNFQFPLGKVIAITGRNGAGKSSLLEEIMNRSEGLDISPKVRIETYRQMDYKLFTDEPVIRHLMKQTDFSEPVVRSMLQNLGFSQDEVTKPLHDLSGGEATRVSLALMFVRPSNVLILDEPTNFIDLDTIEALEKFIDAYKGTVIVTSHDKYFIERVADHIYKIEDHKLVSVL
ncbi:ribosomal protection-like ABC-F family protein [Salinicoccus halitifaciens]|uniref:Macrolide transport system ATP-binding/permease protein n=1 Tax=Salinicoccus halitifaciens TaxID=1073415 RepID=A0ABV2EAW5_9STAP|nr:ABC-F type ribosomal protection protein [Salinicoccus halitifaciens]MCD2137581.1 ABC-F type ribosomal protection protein [Salinicoccus halitifaciens]